jgi:hypothetical protein
MRAGGSNLARILEVKRRKGFTGFFAVGPFSFWWREKVGERAFFSG